MQTFNAGQQRGPGSSGEKNGGWIKVSLPFACQGLRVQIRFRQIFLVLRGSVLKFALGGLISRGKKDRRPKPKTISIVKYDRTM